MVGGHDVGGCVVYVNTYMMHRDKSIWGPDADDFRPERFEDEAAIKALHPYAYLPFSKGPRDCLGQTFANLEAKTVLAMLFSRFRFELTRAEEEAPGYRFTTFPKYGVPVKVSRRAA